jgi:hypothetical protein
MRTSDALCRATSPRGAGSLPASRGARPLGAGRPAVRHPRTPYVELRRARIAGPAAGLGRRTPNEPERLPSNRPGSRDPSRLGRVCCSLTRRHPAPCRLPRAWATSSKDGWSLQAIPSPPPCLGLPRSATTDTRKMRLSDFCNRLQTRAPHRLPDSRVRPPPCLRPSREEARRRTRTHPRPMASGEPPGEASLDGEPPASALSQPVPFRRAWVSPFATRRAP